MEGLMLTGLKCASVWFPFSTPFKGNTIFENYMAQNQRKISWNAQTTTALSRSLYMSLVSIEYRYRSNQSHDLNDTLA